MRNCLLFFPLFVLCVGVGCWSSIQPEAIVPDVGDGWLSFALQPSTQKGKVIRYRATYDTEGKTARFDFEVTVADPTDDPPVSSGRFLAVPGSDPSELLQNLKTTLGAKAIPSKVQRVAELPFKAVILGTHEGHAPDGGFFAGPPGHWTVMKIFVGKKDDAAELFLNFNPVLRKGEFSIKDPDYGDAVLRELAKVL